MKLHNHAIILTLASKQDQFRPEQVTPALTLKQAQRACDELEKAGRIVQVSPGTYAKVRKWGDWR